MSVGGRHRTWQGARSMGASSRLHLGLHNSHQQSDACSLSVTDRRTDLVEMAETARFVATMHALDHLVFRRFR